MKHALLPFTIALNCIVAGANAAPLQPPDALMADGIPPIAEEVRIATLPYMEARSARFAGWNPRSRGMLITTRFANTEQVHEVASPGAARRQHTFELEPVSTAGYAPGRGDVLVVSKDVGGNEFYQLYVLEQGRLRLLTDGSSRNTAALWNRDGSSLGYSSTRRNGTDSDLYMIDPRDPKSDRMVAQVQGGGWWFLDFSPSGKRALVANYRSVNDQRLYELAVSTGELRQLGRKDQTAVVHSGAAYGPDGSIYAISDVDSDFRRLGVLDVATGTFDVIDHNAGQRHDVEDFRVSADGTFIAYVVNEAGVSRLRLVDPKSRRPLGEAALPAGVISSLEIAPWGMVGLTLSSAQTSSDAYSVDPKTLTIARWTQSENGGLDPSRNAVAELVTVKSFDGLEVSGFLYRPRVERFAGKRPLIVVIHGGPESQSRPRFIGSNNYLVNELGIALFYPNVRGSTGYGKRFVALDDGPKREDSVKDIGAFLDALGRDAQVDAQRIGITGGSYGGYMTLASIIHYSDKVRAAIEVVGISNFTTFLTNTQSYRRDLRRVEYGDERDPSMRALFERISPLRRAREIRTPLMVVTGANDPRVPASEADQIVAAVRGAGGTAWHLLARNEGHGFAKKENVDFQFWSSVAFWQQWLLN